jgi:hypothetical protein
MSTSTRYVGTCPVCDSRFKVRGGSLVHHGYKRPGHGFIVGDCFAVGRTPHEVSPETAKAYRERVELHLEVLEAHKVSTEQAEDLVYSYTIYVSHREKTPVTVHVKRGEDARYEGNHRVPSFADVQRNILRQLAHEIQSCQGEVARMSKLEATWVELPLTTLEEETIRVTKEKLAARALVKAERDAKKAATSARKVAREARLQEKIVACQKRARALLDAVDANDVQAVRRAYLKVLEIKLPSAVAFSFYREDLDRTELLRSAGLLRTNGTPMVTFSEVLGIPGKGTR